MTAVLSPPAPAVVRPATEPAVVYYPGGEVPITYGGTRYLHYRVRTVQVNPPTIDLGEIPAPVPGATLDRANVTAGLNMTVTLEAEWRETVTTGGGANYRFRVGDATTAGVVRSITYGADDGWLYYATADGAGGSSTANYYYVPASPADRLREMMRERCAPRVHVRRSAAGPPRDAREERARETLRRVVGDEEYHRYLSRGFVRVRGKSGDLYLVKGGHNQTERYRNGKLVQRLCVVLLGSFPDTDSTIVRYLMILNDEAGFMKLANKTNVTRGIQIQGATRPRPSLAEAFAGLKQTERQVALFREAS